LSEPKKQAVAHLRFVLLFTFWEQPLLERGGKRTYLQISKQKGENYCIIYEDLANSSSAVNSTGRGYCDKYTKSIRDFNAALSKARFSGDGAFVGAVVIFFALAAGVAGPLGIAIILAIVAFVATAVWLCAKMFGINMPYGLVAALMAIGTIAIPLLSLSPVQITFERRPRRIKDRFLDFWRGCFLFRFAVHSQPPPGPMRRCQLCFPKKTTACIKIQAAAPFCHTIFNLPISRQIAW
jgi:hypothetical protein